MMQMNATVDTRLGWRESTCDGADRGVTSATARLAAFRDASFLPIARP
jgi:hypothetical protein